MDLDTIFGVYVSFQRSSHFCVHLKILKRLVTKWIELHSLKIYLLFYNSHWKTHFCDMAAYHLFVQKFDKKIGAQANIL